MSDAIQSESRGASALSSDIAFIRTMVEDGQRGASRYGIGIAAGLIWGSASLYFWAALAKVVDIPGGVAGASWAWPAAMVVFAVAGFPLRMYQRGGNRVAGAAWSAVGWACLTVSAVVGIAAWRLHMGVIVTLLPPIIMALYGGAWLICAAAFRTWFLLAVGVLSLLSSLLLAYTVAQPVEYLLFALSLYLFGAGPSLAGVLRGRSAANA
jgi:hypothetical protein